EYLGRVQLAVELRGNRGDDGDRAVVVVDVVLDDDRGPRLLDFRAAGRLELDEVHVAAQDDGHSLSSLRHTSSESGSHSVAIWRSKSARRMARSFMRARRSARSWAVRFTRS